MIDVSMRRRLSAALAAARKILDAVEMQRGAENVLENPDVHELLIRIARVTKAHVDALEEVLAADGSERDAAVRSAVQGAFGTMTGLFDKLVGPDVSEMLGRDYTALHHSAISSEILHAQAVMTSQPEVAHACVQHIRGLAPILAEMHQVIPRVVVREARAAGAADLDGPAPELERILEAWEIDVDRSTSS